MAVWKGAGKSRCSKRKVRCLEVRCPSGAKPSGSQARWKPGVTGCKGVVRKPDVQVEARPSGSRV